MSLQRSRQNRHRDLLQSVSPAAPAIPAVPAAAAQNGHQGSSGSSPSGPYYSPSPHSYNTFGAKKNRHNDQSDILDKLGRNPHLESELQKQYGGQAREMAVKEYTQGESKESRLIDEIIANRNREFSQRKENNALHLRSLNEERQRILKEKDRLEEKKRRLRESPVADWRAEDRPEIAARPKRVTIQMERSSRASVHDVTSYLRDASDNLPQQIERVNKLKKMHEKRIERLVRPYQGELGPQSYEPWQMQHYHMARAIVERVVENFLDMYFRSHQPAVSTDQALALMQADSLSREGQREGLRKANLTQLIMEELVLEETGKFAREVAREYKNLHQYVKNRADMHFMRQGEAVATGDPSGRDENDPLYHLITKGYFNFQKERFQKRKDIWTHRQHAHIKDDAEKVEDEEQEEQDADVETLYFGDILPMDMREYTMKPHDSYQERVRKRDFGRYMVPAKLYWEKIWCETKEVELASKCQGVTTAAVSWNNRLIALGTAHGDLLIYDLAARPYRVLRAIANSTKYLDPIDSIAWSLDGTKLVTTNTLGGTVKAWSWHASGVSVERSDLGSIGVKADDAGYVPGPLRNVLDLDVDRFETKFQSGALAEMDLHKSVYGPTMATFFTTLSFFGSQNEVCIALDNGDILKCDVEENYGENMIQVDRSQGGPPITVTKDAPKIYKPKIPVEVGISRIGQGVPAELLRQHKFPIICMGFVENNRNMISVDQKGFINLWRYHPRSLNSYSYFKAHKQYRIDFNKTMYAPVTTAKPVLVFTDRPRAGARLKTRQEIAREREEVEKQIENIGLPDPWHKQAANKDGLVTTIYAPLEQVSESGAIFHIVIRKQDGVLSSYATRVYKPVKLKSTKMIGCRLTPDGKELVFVFLFPEYPPKQPHLTIVRVDVVAMVMVDWRRDITLDGPLYQRICEEDIVNFDISQVHGATGTAYIFMNIAGDLHGYSLTSGLKVLRSFDHNNPEKPFKGATVGISDFRIADSAQISVANYAGRFYLVVYSSSKRDSEQVVKAGRNKKLHNKVVFIELLDFNKDPARLSVWELYSKRPDCAPLPPNTHVVNALYSRASTNHHRTAYVRQVLMDVIDDVIEAKTGKYSDDMLDVHEKLDRVRNYSQLEPDITGRRTPPEEGEEPEVEYDPADIQRGLSPAGQP